MTIGQGFPGLKNDGSVDVNMQSSTNPLFQYFLIQEQKTDITLTADIAQDDEVINVSAGHGFTGAAGEFLVAWENNRYLQMPVKSVAVNAITVNHPVANVFTAAGTQIIRGNNKMNVTGAVTPVNFIMNIRDFTIPIDLSKIVLTMRHSGVPDDGKFGGITALTNGVWFRKQDGTDFNLGNYVDNQSFKTYGAVVEYTDKAPSSEYATNVVFNLIEIFEQVVRIDARNADVLFSQVRDDLTGLTSFTISLIGSYTSGE